MTHEWIFGWWNLVFLAPFLLALIYLGVYAASGVTFGDADADGDGGGDLGHDADAGDLGHDVDADAADVDADTDADLDADHDLDAGDANTDADSDADGDGDSDSNGHEGHGTSYLAALTWLGVGRVPLSIVLMVLLLSWGAIGFATNVLAADLFARPWQLLMLSLPAAAAGSMLVTGGVSNAIVRMIPLNETSARRRHELLGSVGEAIFEINDSSGVVSVRDEHGDLFQVSARVEPSDATTTTTTRIAKGNKVRLVAYDAPRKLFFVRIHQPAEAGGPNTPAPANTRL